MLNVLVSTNENTVVSEYTPDLNRASGYQTEDALEKAFIDLLVSQGYDYVNIKSMDDMVNNLRDRIEKLNNYKFTDNEWSRFYRECIANNNEGIREKSRKIQEESTQLLITDDGSSKNIKLIDKSNIHNNYLQVINQYEVNDGSYKNRYDVTILVNGLPLIHIELKRRGVELKEAFNQIERYKRESFWASDALYEYVQIFIISNGTHTKYYSNTTRDLAVKEKSSLNNKRSKKKSHSFEFTSFWADSKNNTIKDLMDFTKTFLARHTILNVLTKYCVFTEEQLLLVMRPYQIVATERILNRIEIAQNYKKAGSIEAGGYVWHTTGSGKTLTSFKTSQLASKMDGVDKVIFVVDRKDLDYQTMKEYDRFAKGSANGNKDTRTLTRQLEDKDEKGNYCEYKIIVTTIQKLSRFIRKNATHPVYDKHVVMIFDECHRSQFGDMHQNIIDKFNKYYIFGFTGTPIFKENASSGGKNIKIRTTGQAFVDKLHTYTIIDAIRDGNVLPFKIDYVNTMKVKENIKDHQVKGINTEEALLSPERIKGVTSYILDHFNQKTKRNNGYYSFSSVTNIKDIARGNTDEEHRTKISLNGFNSIFAVSSIDAAKLYYMEFKRQMEEDPSKKLRIATIFSYEANEEIKDEIGGHIDDENSDSTKDLPESSKDFLRMAIEDYNKMFGTYYDISDDKFPNYYKDLSLRMKNREVDLLIVVNMFLTGFDATTLNTLWIDKNLKMHGLIQAFSRTNRILNSVKTYGNIVCFRDLQEETDRAIALFGDKDASGVITLKPFENYFNAYMDKMDELKEKYPIGKTLECEQDEKDFISIIGNILRLKNILDSFDEFNEDEIIKPIDMQDYIGMYNDLHRKYRSREKGEKENINDDIVFEIELVRQIEVNIDYIINLVIKYHDSNCENREILEHINKAIGSSFNLRNKGELIQEFLDKINSDVDDVMVAWRKHVLEQMANDMDTMIKEEKLKEAEFRRYMRGCFRDGQVKTMGTYIDDFMPPMSLFSQNNNRELKKNRIIEKVKVFFDKYFDLITTGDFDVKYANCK